MSTSVGLGTGIKTPEEPESESKDYLWGFFEQGEEFAEEMVGTRIKDYAGEDIPIIKAGSLAILAFGIRTYREFMFGVASLAAYYYFAKDDNPSLDGAISGLAAVQIARKQYLTAAFPTFIETYSSFRDWREGKFMTQKQFLKTAIYVVGFYLGLKKVV